jgi:hypothetical protein
MDRSGLVIYL